MSLAPPAPPGDGGDRGRVSRAPAGSAENPLEITDPRAMRALAHPARLAILQHLIIEGPATATECAEVAGLSPSACSYHLRALAAHGFAEEDLASAADGRHRPWRARVVALSFGGDPGQASALRAASRMLQESVQARIEEVREQFRDREAEYPPQWQAASGMTQDVVHVTAAELAALRDELRDVVGRYRRLDPAQRPPGTIRVHSVLDFVPWFDPGRAAGTKRAAARD
jgi:DNA-binding transcriptional ArsR family regulator